MQLTTEKSRSSSPEDNVNQESLELVKIVVKKFTNVKEEWRFQATVCTAKNASHLGFMTIRKGEKRMTNDEYRKEDGISRSELQLFRKSPKHYEYSKNNAVKVSSKALDFGSASHKWILEKDDFFSEFAVAPSVDRRTTEGKKLWSEFVESSEGKTVITSEDMETIIQMGIAIDEHPYARKLLEGKHEQSFFWTDTETGEKAKCRPDSMTDVCGNQIHKDLDNKKYIVDYKTTDSCEDGHFERSCKKYGYKLQSGMYREGVFQNTFEDYGFAFVAQEKTAPYCVRVFVCSEQYINEGYDEYRALMALYHKCKVEGKFPSYEGFDNEFDYLREDE